MKNRVTIIFEDDFETGDLSKWTDVLQQDEGSAEINTDNPKSGTYNLKCVRRDGAAAGNFNCVLKAGIGGTAHEHLFAQASNVKINTMPAGADNKISILWFSQSEGSNMVGCAGFKSVGGVLKFYIRYRNAEAFSDVISTIDAEVDTNYVLELEIKQSTEGQSDGEQRLYVNGQLVCEITGIDNDDRTIGFIHLGIVNAYSIGTGDVTIWADDFKLSDTYIGVVVPPTLSEQMTEMMNTMINLMMVVMIIRMMSSMMKGLKK